MRGHGKLRPWDMSNLAQRSTHTRQVKVAVIILNTMRLGSKKSFRISTAAVCRWGGLSDGRYLAVRRGEGACHCEWLFTVTGTFSEEKKTKREQMTILKR